jgi:hypothetical protein
MVRGCVTKGLRHYGVASSIGFVDLVLKLPMCLLLFLTIDKRHGNVEDA